jgi:hypothetical protein
MKTKKLAREDFFVGPVHIIWRGYKSHPQYGFLAWGSARRWTLDVWIHQRLLTLRRREW